MHVYYAKETVMTIEEAKYYLFKKLDQLKNPTARAISGAGWDVLFSLKMKYNGSGRKIFDSWVEEWKNQPLRRE